MHVLTKKCPGSGGPGGKPAQAVVGIRLARTSALAESLVPFKSPTLVVRITLNSMQLLQPSCQIDEKLYRS
jgi:hypothetical protein